MKASFYSREGGGGDRGGGGCPRVRWLSGMALTDTNYPGLLKSPSCILTLHLAPSPAAASQPAAAHGRAASLPEACRGGGRTRSLAITTHRKLPVPSSISTGFASTRSRCVGPVDTDPLYEACSMAVCEPRVAQPPPGQGHAG